VKELGFQNNTKLIESKINYLNQLIIRLRSYISKEAFVEKEFEIDKNFAKQWKVIENKLKQELDRIEKETRIRIKRDFDFPPGFEFPKFLKANHIKIENQYEKLMNEIKNLKIQIFQKQFSEVLNEIMRLHESGEINEDLAELYQTWESNLESELNSILTSMEISPNEYGIIEEYKMLKLNSEKIEKLFTERAFPRSNQKSARAASVVTKLSKLNKKRIQSIYRTISKIDGIAQTIVNYRGEYMISKAAFNSRKAASISEKNLVQNAVPVEGSDGIFIASNEEE
ncbi:MAG: hypothetical protein VW079_02000, partial [Candidatus Woesearchaeota archaeon]